MGPGAAPVGAFKHIRSKVSRLVVVDYHVDGISVVEVCLDVVDKEIIGYFRQALDHPPVAAAIFGDMNASVVRARIQKAFRQG